MGKEEKVDLLTGVTMTCSVTLIMEKKSRKSKNCKTFWNTKEQPASAKFTW